MASFTVLAISTVFAYLLCRWSIPDVATILFRAKITGRDVHKPERPVLPESLGIAPGIVYLIALFCLFTFDLTREQSTVTPLLDKSFLPTGHGVKMFRLLATWCAALLSVQSMILLGIMDDVLDIRWRNKILLPSLAAIPLLVIYWLAGGLTFVKLPWPISDLLGMSTVELGPLYYLWMLMVTIFSTHAINILAGLNGLEVGQCMILGGGLLLNALLGRDPMMPQLLAPFLAVSFALLQYNWCPAQVFVGDVYCYFGGMTLAVAAILGHSQRP